MKRTILFLTAISILALTGCSEQQNISETPPEIINDTEAPTEPVFMEYRPEDFHEIEVNINAQKGLPDMEYNEYTVSVLAEKEKMSKCKKDFVVDTEIVIPEEVAEENIPDYEQYILEFQKRQYESKDTPNKGALYCYSYSDDKFYFVRNYDDVCGGSHCFDVCEYDISRGETNCIFSYDAEYSEPMYNLYDIKNINGTFYFSGAYVPADGDVKEGIFTLDSENNALVKLDLEFLKDENNMEFGIFNKSVPDKLYVYSKFDGMYYNVNSGIINDNSFMVHEVDIKTGEYTEIQKDNTSSVYIYSDPIVRAYRNENKELICEQEGVFHLETGLKGAALKGCGNGKVAVNVKDSMDNFLYIYDLEKHERYKYDLRGRGDAESIFPMGDYMYFATLWDTAPYILIPELGLAYDLSGNTQENRIFDGKKVCGVSGKYTGNDYTYGEITLKILNNA